MQRFTLLFAFLLLANLGLNAQQHRGVCGNTYADQMSQIDRYLANKKMAKLRPAQSRNAITYIPIQFIIATKNDGTGAIQLTDLFDQICLLNNQYGEFDIIFYMPEDPKIIANDNIYDDHTKTSAQFLMRQERNREALNVWIVQDATPQQGPPIGITLGYYDTVNDWIIIRKNQISGVNNTMAHEVGHFFSLFHPHLGWDADPYSIDKHGSPVTNKAPSGSETELMDRSNCETAGDMLCDTPPDYNFALTWNDCNFNVDIKDPNGEKVDPDETLLMSYFSDECTSKFTQSQIDMMVSDINRPGRSFLRRSEYTPIATEITEIPNLISPVGSDVTAAYNKVELKWQGVAGAENYLVEVDFSPGFDLDKFKFITNQTSIIIEDILDADKRYNWQVTPYNASYTCAEPSETGKFRTGLSTSVPTIGTVDRWTIQPNPIKSSQQLSINLTASSAFQATINLYTLTGQLIQKQATEFNVGASTVQLEVGDLSKGIYFVSLENAEGVLNKKIVVQ